MSSLFEKALEKLDHEDGAPAADGLEPLAAEAESKPTAVTRPALTPAPDSSPVMREPPAPDLPSPTPQESPPARVERGAQAPVPLAEPSPPSAGVPPAADLSAAGKHDTDPGKRTAHYAEIDLEALAAAGMITPDAAEGTLSEQHRMVKRPLLLKAFPPGGKKVGNENVILVTSSVPAEGKTFVSVNLAMSIAMEVDRTVLLIDGDPAKANITKMFGIAAERGLTDYLSSPDLALPDVLVRTNVPNLVLLPSGKHVANVTELFSSEQMKRLTDELAGRYPDRVIIIDSAPLLAASGTRVLAGLAGQILFVVEAVRTTQSAVREALHMIETHPNIGLVLNKSRERTRSSYQYGYYGAQD